MATVSNTCGLRSQYKVPCVNRMHTIFHFSRKRAIWCPRASIQHTELTKQTTKIRLQHRTTQQNATCISTTAQKLISSYHKYREYYDRKAWAQPLRPKRYCSLLHPLLNTQSEKIKGLQCKFQLLYRVEGALTDSNYLIRKVGTNHTQILHRI